MDPNLVVPTKQEIEIQAAMIFPDSKELQSNFIVAVYMTLHEQNLLDAEPV